MQKADGVCRDQIEVNWCEDPRVVGRGYYRATIIDVLDLVIGKQRRPPGSEVAQ